MNLRRNFEWAFNRTNDNALITVQYYEARACVVIEQSTDAGLTQIEVPEEDALRLSAILDEVAEIIAA